MNKQIILCIGLLASFGAAFGMKDYGTVDRDYTMSIGKVKPEEDTNGNAKSFYIIRNKDNKHLIGFCWYSNNNQYCWQYRSWDNEDALSELKENSRRLGTKEPFRLDLRKKKKNNPPSPDLKYLIIQQHIKRIFELDEFQKNCSQITGQIDGKKMYLKAIGDEGCFRQYNKSLNIEFKWFTSLILTNKKWKVTLNAPEDWLKEIEKIGVVDTTDHSNFLLKLGYEDKTGSKVFDHFTLNIVAITDALKTLQKRKQYAQYARAGVTVTFAAFVAAMYYWLKK